MVKEILNNVLFLFGYKVISETLRLANIINAVWRKALKDVEIKGYLTMLYIFVVIVRYSCLNCLIAGHLIPQGWCVLTSFTSVHMDEENYENPYNFDPWRWEVINSNTKVCFSHTHFNKNNWVYLISLP